MQKLWPFLILVVVGIVSCGDDDDEVDDNAPLAVNINNILGTYKITSITQKAGNAAAQEVVDKIFKACERDNLHVLKTNSQYEFQDAGTKCNPDSSEESSWFLNENVISTAYAFGEVTTLTRKTMIVTERGATSGVTAEIVMTYVRE